MVRVGCNSSFSRDLRKDYLKTQTPLVPSSSNIDIASVLHGKGTERIPGHACRPDVCLFCQPPGRSNFLVRPLLLLWVHRKWFR